MTEIIYLSRAKHKEFTSKLEYLRDTKLPAVRLEMKNAIQTGGGMHDNAGYEDMAQKEKIILNQIAELENIISDSKIINELGIDTKSVHIGTKVRVLDLDTSKETDYVIAGAYETNVDRNLISYQAPLARGLLGKSVGDTIEIKIPKEIRRLKLISIDRVKV